MNGSSKLQVRVDVATLLMRIMLGVVFMYHGSQKLFGWFDGPGIAGTAKFMEGSGLPFPTLAAGLAGSAEFFGGVLLVIGLAVPLFVIPMIFTMLVASFKVHWPAFGAQNNGMEYSLTLAVMLIALGVLGAGRWSVQRMLSGREKRGEMVVNRRV